MKFSFKRVLSFALVLLMVISLLPTTASFDANAAGTLSTITGLTATWTDASNSKGSASWSASGTGITGTATGYQQILSRTVTSKLTLKNTSGGEATLSFSYELTNGGSVSGAISGTSGDYSSVLANNASITITLKSPGGASTNTLRITGLSLISTSAANVTTTFKSGTTGGGYTLGGTEVTGTTTKTEAAGTKYQLVAVPDSGYIFFGWYDEISKSYLDYNATYNYTAAADATIVPKFVSSTAALFGVGAAKFDDLTAAGAAAAAGSTKTIILLNNGTVSGSHTIPAGVTLLVPFDVGNTLYTTEPAHTNNNLLDTATWVTPTAYRTLTLAADANITVNGSISVSGKHFAGGGDPKAGGCGVPTGPVGFVQMVSGSQITLNSGANLYAWGYVTGGGTITAKSGSKVYENFMIRDFRGGGATTSIANDGIVFPLSQYYVQNIEVATNYEYGAEEHVYTSLYISGASYSAGVKFIGEGAMFQPQEGAVLTKDYIENKDRLELTVNGNAALANMALSLAGTEIDSSTFILPMNSNITININSGTTTLKQDLALLPGVELNIAQGAVLDLANGTGSGTISDGTGYNLFVYDLDEWSSGYAVDTFDPEDIANSPKSTGLKFVHQTYDFIALNYVPGRTYTRTASDLKDAVINVNGTIITDGFLYTTEGGASIISSEKTGVIAMNSGAGAEAWTYQAAQVDTTAVYYAILCNSAALKNGDGSYVSTADATEGTTYNYCATHDCWYTGECAECALPSTVEVIWSVNGTTVKQEVDYNTVPVYNNGIALNKTSDATYHYTFAGWATSENGTVLSALPAATEDAEYYAVFTAVAHADTDKAAVDGKHYCDTCNYLMYSCKNENAAVDHVCDYGCNTVLDKCADVNGDKNHTCDVCKKENVTSCTGGTAVEENRSEPTCGAAGSYDSVVYCSECGKEMSRTKTTIPATENHKYTIEVAGTRVDATCNTTGSVTMQCANCSATQVKTLAIDANNHANIVTDAAVDPGCTSTGLTEGSHCDACGKTVVEQEEVAATGHGAKVTYKDNGDGTHSATYDCCGADFVTGENHEQGTYISSTAGNCVDKATTTYSCGKCHVLFTVTGETNPNNHKSIVTDAAVAPGCTSTGLTEGSHCEACGKTVVAQEEVSAAGHNHVNGKCTVCGDTLKVTLNGIVNGWDGVEMTWNDGGIYTYEMHLDAGTYQFKIVDNGTWLGNYGTIPDTTEGAENGWLMEALNGGDETNCKLQASGGTYTFSYNIETDHLIVTAVLDHVHNHVNGKCECGDEIGVYLMGIDENWNPGRTMTRNEDGTYTIELDLTGGTYKFKIKKSDGSWYRVDNSVIDKTTGAVAMVSMDGNSTLIASGGTYTFTYDINNHTLKVDADLPHTHTYGNPVFAWDPYYTSCTVTYTCGNEDGKCEATSLEVGCNVECTVNADNQLVFTATSTYAAADTDTKIATPANSRAIYLYNAAGWTTMNVHYWNDSDGTAWPGVPMTKVGENLYVVILPVGYDQFIINNKISSSDGGNFQTGDLSIGDLNGANVYNNANGKWGYNEPSKHTITWNACGKTETTTVYYGATPVCPFDTLDYKNGCAVFTFSKWDQDIVAVTGDATYTAQYTRSNSHVGDANNDHYCDFEGCKDKLSNCVDANADHKCDYTGCGATMSNCADNNNDHYCDSEGCKDKLSDCIDANADHKCDYTGCGATMSDCADNNNDHYCDSEGCKGKLSDCIDANADHKCDYTGCGATLSECADNDNDHYCDFEGCKDKLSNCVDANADHKCDYSGCGVAMSECADDANDGDHNCDFAGCGKAVADSVCYGGQADCTSGPICEDCGEEHGEPLGHGHTEGFGYTDLENGNHSVTCKDCGEVTVESEGHDYTYNTQNHECECGAVETFTVTWMFNGGVMDEQWKQQLISEGFTVTDTSASSTFPYGEFAPDTTGVTKDGYILIGYTDQYGNFNEGQKIFTLAEDMTFTMVWECAHSDKTYTDLGNGFHKVTCDTCGETVVESEGHDYTYNTRYHKCQCGAVEEFKLTVVYGPNGEYTYEAMVPYWTRMDSLDEINNIPWTVYVNDATHFGHYDLYDFYWDMDGDGDLDWDRYFLEGYMTDEDMYVEAQYRFTGFAHDGNGWQVMDYGSVYKNQMIILTMADLYENGSEEEIEGVYMGDANGYRIENGMGRWYYLGQWNGVTYEPNAEDIAYYEGKGQTFIDKEMTWYYFGDDGKLAFDYTGLVGDSYVINGQAAWHVGLVKIDGDYYYFKGDEVNGGNKMVSGGDFYLNRNNSDFNMVAGGIYTFDENGVMQLFHGITESELFEGKRHYIGGRLTPGLGLVDLVTAATGEVRYFYVDSDGQLILDAEYYIGANNFGLAKGIYYFDADGFLVIPEPEVGKNGFYFEDGAWFYYVDGAKAYCAGLICTTGINWYETADAEGVENQGWVYVKSNGALATGEYYVTNVNNHASIASGDLCVFGADCLLQTEKDGIVAENGGLYYYVNNKLALAAGLIETENGYIYVRSNGQLVVGTKYWITNVNQTGVVQGWYEFDENGIMLNAETEVKNGVVDGYYYVDGKIAYAAGLIEIEPGKFIYVRSNGQLATGLYWTTNHNGELAEGLYDFGEDGYLVVE